MLAVKITSDSGSSFTVAGYAVVWHGQDVVGDSFTPATDFWFDRLTHNPPILYQHGKDELIKRAVVGRVVTKRLDDMGLWVEAQITASKKYADAIRDLVNKGVLGWSSGSVPHLVARKKGPTPGTAEITSWPIVEISLTPTPAEPRTIGVKELKALALIEPSLKQMADDAETVNEGTLEDLLEDLREAACDLLGSCSVIASYNDHVVVSVMAGMGGMADTNYFSIPYTLDADGDPVLGNPEQVEMTFTPMTGGAKATLTSGARNNLSAGDFAYVDSSGGRHLPIHDEAHVRAAMSRFNQTAFESPEKKKAAARKIRARASSLGIDVSPDSAVAMAAKGGPLMEDEQTEEQVVEGPQDGSAARLWAIGTRLRELALVQVEDRKAMDRFGVDTKDGQRFHDATLAKVKAEIKELEHLVEWATAIREGEDGLRRVNYYKHRLALINLEASA